MKSKNDGANQENNEELCTGVLYFVDSCNSCKVIPIDVAVNPRPKTIEQLLIIYAVVVGWHISIGAQRVGTKIMSGTTIMPKAFSHRVLVNCDL